MDSNAYRTIMIGHVVAKIYGTVMEESSMIIWRQ